MSGDRVERERVERERVERRASRLLPEERRAGSDDRLAQAEAILADSDGRTGGQIASTDGSLERRTSDQTVPPPE
ncbi:hypothetical protein [Rugosimonospora africana]|nr:hypothetical protein [Rugosimonospora africana]